MLWTLAVVFFILWVLGLLHVYSIGAWVWLFFVVWIVCLVARLAGGRSPAPPAS